VDQLLDLLGRIGRALSQFAHFLGDDREAAAGFTGTCRFDTGIERQKVGLEGDLVNHTDDVGNLIGAFLDPAHGIFGTAHHLGDSTADEFA
jgi:hypothetical protein